MPVPETKCGVGEKPVDSLATCSTTIQRLLAVLGPHATTVAFHTQNGTMNYFSVERLHLKPSMVDIGAMLHRAEAEKSHCTITLRVREGVVVSMHHRQTGEGLDDLEKII